MLLAALRSPTSPDGAREQEVVAGIAAAVRAAPTPLDARRKRMSIRSVPARFAVAGAAVLLLSGTAAAAATGSLPDPAQHAVSSALAHVSVSVPDPGDHADAHADAHAPTHAAGSTPVGVDPTGEARHGLCTAWAARNRGDSPRGNSADSTAFTNLRHAAHDQGLLVKDFCADVLTAGHGAVAEPSADPGPTGEDPGRGRSGTAHGAPAGTPPVTTPDGGGTATADGAADGVDATGTGHAAPQATTGSANAVGHGPSGGHAAP